MGMAGHVTAFDFHSFEVEGSLEAIFTCMSTCRAGQWRSLPASAILHALPVSSPSGARSAHAPPSLRTTVSVRGQHVICSAWLARWSRQLTVARGMEPVNELWENQRFYGIVGWCAASASRLSQHSANVAPAGSASRSLAWLWYFATPPFPGLRPHHPPISEALTSPGTTRSAGRRQAFWRGQASAMPRATPLQSTSGRQRRSLLVGAWSCRPPLTLRAGSMDPSSSAGLSRPLSRHVIDRSLLPVLTLLTIGSWSKTSIMSICPAAACSLKHMDQLG